MRRAAVGVFNGNWRHQWQTEPDSDPLPLERNLPELARIYQTLTDYARAFALGQSLAGQDYDEKCQAYLAEIEKVKNGTN